MFHTAKPSFADRITPLLSSENEILPILQYRIVRLSVVILYKAMCQTNITKNKKRRL